MKETAEAPTEEINPRFALTKTEYKAFLKYCEANDWSMSKACGHLVRDGLAREAKK